MRRASANKRAVVVGRAVAYKRATAVGHASWMKSVSTVGHAAASKRVVAVRRTSAYKRAVAVRRTLAKKRVSAMRHATVKKRRPQVVRIAVLRHGVTQANIERRYISRSDVPLSASAHAALAPARRRIAGERPLAFTSDLSRCTATLAHVCPHSSGRREYHRYTRNVGLAREARDAVNARNADCARGAWCGGTADKAVVRDARLRELNFGRWEGLTYEDLRSDAHYRAWLDDMTAVIPPDGESWQQFAARTEAAWRDILRQASMNRPRRAAHRGANPIAVLVVTHGGVLRRLHSLAWPAASFWDIPAPTGGGYVLVAQRQGKHWRFLRTEPLTVLPGGAPNK